ncbi:MAG TPA: hypothetical protein VG735_14050 [Caulobacterales bacterium]|nr:hypothetical protein [Caulobacterales bacterium]
MTIFASRFLRVRMDSLVTEDQWASIGLTLLASDPDRSLVLFASEQNLRTFQQRLAAYSGPVPQGQANPPYAGFVASIASVEPVGPGDRIGRRFKDEGFAGPDDFDPSATYAVDIEVWDLGTRAARQSKLDEIEAFATSAGGEVLDRYLGPSIALTRVRVMGSVIRELLDVPEIAAIDLPPSLDSEKSTRLELSLPETPPLGAVPPDAPLIGIIDSGVNDHPLIADAVIGAISVPE